MYWQGSIVSLVDNSGQQRRGADDEHTRDGKERPNDHDMARLATVIGHVAAERRGQRVRRGHYQEHQAHLQGSQVELNRTS